jgi:hypothetical protein
VSAATNLPPRATAESAEVVPPAAGTEILILEDGRIMAHNVTPAILTLLLSLAPNDPELLARAAAAHPLAL